MFDFSKIAMRIGHSRGATIEQISELEKYCGYSLPDSYTFILKNYNGAELEKQELCVFDDEMGINVAYEFQAFFIVDEHKDLPKNIWQAIEQYSNLIESGSLPFAYGENSFYYFKCVQNIVQVWCFAFMEDEEPEEFLMFDSLDEMLRVF